MEAFLRFAGCTKQEYELFCKAFEAEMNEATTDGLAQTELQSLMGLKLPVLVTHDDLSTYKHYGLRLVFFI